MATIDENNYELYLLQYAENQLDEDTIADVEEWLTGHPDKAEELAMYCAAPRLERDENIHYNANIKRRAAIIPLPFKRAAAAAVIALLSISVFMTIHHTTAVNEMVVAENTNNVPQTNTIPSETTEHSGHEPATRDKSDKTGNIMATQRDYTENVTESSKPIVAYMTVQSSESTKRNQDGDDISIEQHLDATLQTAPDILATTTLIRVDTNTLDSDNTKNHKDIENTNTLIQHDPNIDLGDILLATNTEKREEFSMHPVGRLMTYAWPSSQQLATTIIDPMRERIGKIKSKLK